MTDSTKCDIELPIDVICHMLNLYDPCLDFVRVRTSTTSKDLQKQIQARVKLQEPRDSNFVLRHPQWKFYSIKFFYNSDVYEYEHAEVVEITGPLRACWLDAVRKNGGPLIFPAAKMVTLRSLDAYTRSVQRDTFWIFPTAGIVKNFGYELFVRCNFEQVFPRVHSLQVSAAQVLAWCDEETVKKLTKVTALGSTRVCQVDDNGIRHIITPPCRLGYSGNGARFENLRVLDMRGNNALECAPGTLPVLEELSIQSADKIAHIDSTHAPKLKKIRFYTTPKEEDLANIREKWPGVICETRDPYDV